MKKILLVLLVLGIGITAYAQTKYEQNNLTQLVSQGMAHNFKGSFQKAFTENGIDVYEVKFEWSEKYQHSENAAKLFMEMLDSYTVYIPWMEHESKQIEQTWYSVKGTNYYTIITCVKEMNVLLIFSQYIEE